MGFMTGSLGVVLPWKEKIFKLNENGEIILDSQGNGVIDYYDRYFPTFSSAETWLAIFFIFVCILIVLGLAWYEKKNHKPATR